ncbi:S41 family peptidase [Eubacterium aggregans]|uniref:S41 family peptidase n=1 Tax=Eubacterium aggregans TaxID=81409 RepID=UPI003F37300D
MKKQKINLTVVFVLVLILSNLGTYFLALNGVFNGKNSVNFKTDSQTISSGLQKIASLEKKIQSDYYKDVDEQALMDGAIKGMFDAIGDEYSAYYTKDEYTKLMESTTGSFEGIGVVVTEDGNKNTIVVTPYKYTPAGNAGIQTGDTIIKVDDEDVTGNGMDYAVSKMRGTAGTPVKVTVSRDGQEIDFNLTRDTIDTKTVDSKVLGNNIGYIEISQFTETTGEEFKEQIDNLMAQGIQGLAIDLRYNGGGLVDQSVEVADRLLGQTEVVYTMDKQGNRKDYRATSEDQVTVPVTVLVNEGTASASEILAGAIQDTQAGTLIGTKTFGKGIVQEVISLMDGTGYKLTNAKYFTPNGRNIHSVGLTPDVEINQNENYKDTLVVPEEQDTQMQKALEVLQSKM